MTSLRLIAIVLIGLLIPVPSAAQEPARVVVDTDALTLTVFRGDRVLAVFENISIGRGGTTRLKHHQDGKTPLGTYEIIRADYDSNFHLFFGFDYPTADQAWRAFDAGMIDRRTYRRIVRAQRHGRVPPQTTPLGGYIGIHGIGDGSLAVHRRFNWTEGCIALTNKQIERLDQWVGIGTTVVVR